MQVVSATLVAAALSLLAVAVFAGLRRLSEAMGTLGESVSGFWSGQTNQQAEYVALDELIAQAHLNSPDGFGITDDMVLETEAPGAAQQPQVDLL